MLQAGIECPGPDLHDPLNMLQPYTCRILQTLITSGHTLKTSIPVEDVDPILKLLRGVSHPEMHLGVAIHSEKHPEQGSIYIV